MPNVIVNIRAVFQSIRQIFNWGQTSNTFWGQSSNKKWGQ